MEALVWMDVMAVLEECMLVDEAQVSPLSPYAYLHTRLPVLLRVSSHPFVVLRDAYPHIHTPVLCYACLHTQSQY